MKQVVAVLLASWLPAVGADFAILNLKIVEGDGLVYAPGSRATRGVTVEVSDETGRPVEGVTVSFQLPEDGPSGTFISGGRSEIVTTKADGKAGVWGMRWNANAGPVQIRITAAKAGVRAGMIATVQLDASAKPQNAKVSGGGGGHSKLILIALAAAGAAGAGLAAGALSAKKSTSTSAATTSASVGAPTVVVGGPQ